jgi:hypothetical protein
MRHAEESLAAGYRSCRSNRREMSIQVTAWGYDVMSRVARAVEGLTTVVYSADYLYVASNKGYI